MNVEPSDCCLACYLDMPCSCPPPRPPYTVWYNYLANGKQHSGSMGFTNLRDATQWALKDLPRAPRLHLEAIVGPDGRVLDLSKLLR